MHSVEISATSEKFLSKLPKKEAARILEKLHSIREEPFRHVARLKGTGLWKLKVGDYRAELEILIKGATIFVVRIGHRKNIYKQRL